MSGCYVNTSTAAAWAGTGRNTPPVTQRGQAIPLSPLVSSSSLSSTSPSTSGAVTSRQRQHQHQHQHQHQQQRHRPNQQQPAPRPQSVLSRGISQVYELTGGAKPPCLHRAAVSPALWLLCQTVLVVLFALCCVYLVNGGSSSSSWNSRGSMESSQGGNRKSSRKLFVRLEFESESNPEYRTNDSAYGKLVCFSGENSKQPCDQGFVKLIDDTGSGTRIRIMEGAVYRINAAVTFRLLNGTWKYDVDTSVKVEGEELAWISCQQGVSAGIPQQYAHCTLYGIRYLTKGAELMFRSSRSGLVIIRGGGSTYFEIEQR